MAAYPHWDLHNTRILSTLNNVSLCIQFDTIMSYSGFASNVLDCVGFGPREVFENGFTEFEAKVQE